jgi:hypothetical protein
MKKVAMIAVGVYWINNFKIKACASDPLDYCDDVATGFANAMKAAGHKLAFVNSEQRVSPRQWNFNTAQGVGGVETVELAYLVTHGRADGKDRGKSGWLYWVVAPFDSKDGCWVAPIKLKVDRATSKWWQPTNVQYPETAMRLGVGHLRWVVLDLCNSLQVRLENIRHDPQRDPHDERKTTFAEINPRRIWERCFDGVSMLFGFTGYSSDSRWTKSRGASFGRRAGRGEALADSWVDEAYSSWFDDAPVVLACGRSPEDAVKRLMGEGLAAVSPRLRVKEIRAYCWMWRS